jgi:hypothetical protein
MKPKYILFQCITTLLWLWHYSIVNGNEIALVNSNRELCRASIYEITLLIIFHCPELGAQVFSLPES